MSLSELEDRQQRLRKMMARLALKDAWALEVAVLQCFHSINTEATLTLVPELFEVGRFRSPWGLMNYLGLTPSSPRS